MQKQIILPSLEHSNVFVQCLNVCLVDFSKVCAVVLGGKPLNSEDMYFIHLKCHYDEILDNHFFTFSCTVGLS